MKRYIVPLILAASFLLFGDSPMLGFSTASAKRKVNAHSKLSSHVRRRARKRRRKRRISRRSLVSNYSNRSKRLHQCKSRSCLRRFGHRGTRATVYRMTVKECKRAIRKTFTIKDGPKVRRYWLAQCEKVYGRTAAIKVTR